VAHLAAQRSIEMPIATMVAAVLDQNLSVADAVQALMNRPLKEE
jgi:glycerol-3-phosphate dehydrogenase (NAD(P)+)